MQLDSYFNNIWYVHTNTNKFDSMWTSRREARQRKRDLRRQGETDVVLSFVPMSFGERVTDNHS